MQNISFYTMTNFKIKNKIIVLAVPVTIICFMYINFKSTVLNQPSNCTYFPSTDQLNMTDSNWQVTTTSNGTFYFFNAYYDDRNSLPLVRILALVNVIDPIVTVSCKFWYPGLSQPVSVPISRYDMIWERRWGLNKFGASPYLLTCPSPLGSAPKFVSLTVEACGRPNNLLSIHNERDQQKNFLVTVKGIDFDIDVSMLIIEWLEILKTLAVDHVEVFVIRIHPNTKQVLEFYEQQGFVTVKELNYPPELPNGRGENWYQWTQNDLIPYMDSFYRNLYRFQYFIPLDIDEIVLPVKNEDRTWIDLLNRTISKSLNANYDAYPATNCYFLLESPHENDTFKGISRDLRFLSNVYRASNFTPNGGNAKTFMRTDRIFLIHNHFPFACLEPEEDCNLFDIKQEDGYLAHYRIDCNNPECVESKTNPTKDVTLWKYKKEILEGIYKTMKAIGKEW